MDTSPSDAWRLVNVGGRGGQIIRVRNATRLRFEIGVRNAPRPCGLRPQRTASAKKFSESAIFREFFRVFRVYPRAKKLH